MFTLDVDLVMDIHDEVLNPAELRGLAGNKSLEGALARVENRLAYGLIADAFDLAAAYAIAVSQGHCFNDGNKRTAFRCMMVCLEANGIETRFDTEAVGQIIIRAAQRLMDEGELAEWLRARL
ncbi:type II toxin-antitoxin system death-on-curing family toxin [Neotabrizicola shimadae]|uniref:Type II toxin-antitoxin system death-on-curing family toxin n=1 Tax=Neotabrizicola shimadae TaxID=2807096 RepID=A0A8G0ZXZ2_9RHOB|nr:type II toxin-antitoxin system death-on-curing family toxin [Neotabrizicola shimadae]QYZ70971.1 type II toxin-antitoxin system death-on-curing family toxin [Neotabrizicola shimadae]